MPIDADLRQRIVSSAAIGFPDQIAFTHMARRFTAIEVDENSIEWAPSLFRIPGGIPARFQRRTWL